MLNPVFDLKEIILEKKPWLKPGFFFMQTSMFITFEGIEGCGKSTQISLLKNHLVAQGKDVLLTREPGGTEIADQIRSLLVKTANEKLTPTSELLLYYASRAQHVQVKILPALKDGKIVLCDRFNDSSVVYQGVARGGQPEDIRFLSDMVLKGQGPDLTFVLDMPVAEGLRRAQKRSDAQDEEDREDRFEKEQISFHQKVRNGFLQLAKNEPRRIKIIDATLSVSEVHASIVKHVAVFET